MSKEIIAVDVDEVLFPMLESFLDDYNPRYATNHKIDDFSSYDWEHVLGVPQEETVRRVYDYLAKNHHHIEAVKGSQEAIAKLSKNYDLVVVTARHPQFEQSTMNWAHNKFEKVFSKIVCIGYAPVMEKPLSKVEVCLELGAIALVDDSLIHVSQCADAGLDGVLFGNFGWNAADKLPEGVARYNNWDEVVEHFDKRP